MANPIDSPRLSVLAKGKRDCAVIISDHTRPVPSRDIIPHMLAELRLGNPDIDVTLLVATGFHRLSAKEELIEKLGEEIVASERIVVHDSSDPDANVNIGTLPSGAPLVIDKAAANASLLIAEGFIEPHFFAGYSGGRKSVLPGICERKTVLGNHCSAFIGSDFARTGVLDLNPIHRDMIAAAVMAKLAFIVNVVIDESKNTVAAFSGNFLTAHRAGCDFLAKYCEVKPVYSDIVISTNGGEPLDQNIYQCVKSMTAAEASAKPGAVLIICAQCADGTGGEDFYRSLKDCESPTALYASIMKTPQGATIPDQWESQILARVLKKHEVIMVTRSDLAQTVQDMKMTYAPSLDKALAMARAKKGVHASIAVIPNGISVIVKE
jgi:nickel-dependent lactate racemase